MCFSSGNKAVKQAEAAEKQRQEQIAETQRRIEGIFGSPERESDILDLERSVQQYLQGDLDRQHADTSRQLKFANARSGLSGGSADIDLNLRLGDDYLRGILEAERKAKSAGASLRQQDAETKSGLFSQVLGGLDATTAAQNAASALQQNSALAKSTAFQQGFDNLFSDFSSIFKNSKEAAGDRTARYDFNALYGQRPKAPAQVAGGALFGGQ